MVRYRGFCRIDNIRIRRLTGLRRKQYTPEELLRVRVQYYGLFAQEEIEARIPNGTYREYGRDSDAHLFTYVLPAFAF